MDNQPCIIVLDDDPAGIQPVHGCLVLTKWDFGTLKVTFEDRANASYFPYNWEFPVYRHFEDSGNIREYILSITSNNFLGKRLPYLPIFRCQV